MSSENNPSGPLPQAPPDLPILSIPREMRGQYLAKRKSEAEGMRDSVRDGVWKSAMAIVNNVRGTGAMYGFPNIGDAAEALFRAVQNGHPDRSDRLDAYVKAVNESYV